MKLSVIIPCYNGARTISVQLEALCGQEYPEPWEVIVADNGSTDRSMSIVQTYQERLPDLKIIDASARPGQPYAMNMGVNASKGDALLFCDADDEVGPGWLAAMAKALTKYDFIAARMDMEKLNSSFAQRARRNGQQHGLQPYVYPTYLPHAAGATIGVNRRVYDMVGGFDEGFRALQDTDFCWKAQLSGVKIHFVKEAVLFYRLRDSSREIFNQARFYGEENVRIYKKYRARGMPKISFKASANTLFRLLLRLAHLFRGEQRSSLIWELGWCLGRLKGCIRYRVWAL